MMIVIQNREDITHNPTFSVMILTITPIPPMANNISIINHLIEFVFILLLFGFSILTRLNCAYEGQDQAGHSREYIAA